MQSPTKKIILWFLVLLLGYNHSRSQEFTVREFQAVYIVSITEYITWKNESSFKQFSIGVVGTGEDYDAFKNVCSGQTIKNNKVIIIPANDLDHIPQTHILFVNDDNCENISKIKRSVSKSTLIITSNCDAKDDYMINFIDNDPEKKFELNIKNILLAGLEISRSIVKLGGGKEANWQDLFTTTDRKLAEAKQTLEKQQFEIKKQREILDSNIAVLEIKQAEIKIKNDEINDISMVINEKTEVLNDQTRKIDEQKEILGDQLKQIEAQRIIVYLSIFMIVLFAILAFFIYRGYRTKKKANELLQARNETISKQKDEIEEKTHELEASNAELQQQKEEILAQSEKLSKAYTQLKTLEQFKQGTISMIVHDLKNPLNTIISFADMQPSLGHSSKILQAGKQMLTLVMNILDTQKFESAEVQLNPEKIQIYKIVSETIDSIELLIRDKNIQLKTEFTSDLGGKFDHDLILRVLINLMTNAIKYSPAGGKVKISASETNTENGDFLKFSVSDEGKGIPEALHDKIFDKFGQVEAKKSGIASSTGLGLTFCKTVVEAHGGEIWLTSIEGDKKDHTKEHGTKFFFTLPGVVIIKDDLIDDIMIEEAGTEIIELKLTDDDKNYLHEFIPQFQSISIYDTGEILKVIDDIKKKAENSDSESLNMWINRLEDAAFNINEEQFTELKEMIA